MNMMSKKALSLSAAMYLAVAIWIGFPYFGIIKQPDGAFDSSAIFGFFLDIVLAGLFLLYRKEKVHPIGVVQTLNHVVITAAGWLAVVFAPFAAFGALFLIALHSWVFVVNLGF